MARRPPASWLLILLLIGLVGCAGAKPLVDSESLSIAGEPAPAIPAEGEPTSNTPNAAPNAPQAAPSTQPNSPVVAPSNAQTPTAPRLPPALTTPHQPLGFPPLLSRMLYRATPTVDEVLDGVTAIALEPWQEEVLVGAGDVRLTWQLDTHDAGAYLDRLRFSGAQPDHVRTVMGAIEVTFAAPNPPAWDAWLAGVEGSRVSFAREPEPSATVGFRPAEGELAPIEGQEAAIPAGRLVLLFQFDQPIHRQSVAEWRTHLVEMTGAPVTMRWTGENQLTMEMGSVPTRVEIDLRRLVSARTGLPVNHEPITLWNQESLPYLERVDVATGQAERLLPMPTNITEALPSPGGRWIALRSWAWRGTEMQESRVDVVDLAQSQVTRAPLNGFELHWAGSRLANLGPRWIEGAGWEVWDPLTGAEPERRPEPLTLAAFSPDAVWAAYLGGAESGQPAAPNGPVWNTLLLWEPSSGSRKEVQEFVRGWLFGRDGDYRQRVAWSPDGRKVAALDPVEQTGLSDLVVYDLDREERLVLQAGLPVSPWGRRLAWSPTGGHLAAAAMGQDAAIISLDGSTLIELGGAWHGQAYWDGSGGRLLTADGPWQGVNVYSLADGSRVYLGDGLPAGWSGDDVYIIRWPGAEARYRPPGL